MSRRLLIAAVAPILGAALVVPTATSVDPTTPAPTGSASATTPAAAPLSSIRKGDLAGVPVPG